LPRGTSSPRLEVKVLDVTEEEARKHLLTIYPFAALAQSQQEIQARLRDFAAVSDPEQRTASASAPHSAAALVLLSVGFAHDFLRNVGGIANIPRIRQSQRRQRLGRRHRVGRGRRRWRQRGLRARRGR
jgi:hypothetical protein